MIDTAELSEGAKAEIRYGRASDHIAAMYSRRQVYTRICEALDTFETEEEFHEWLCKSMPGVWARFQAEV